MKSSKSFVLPLIPVVCFSSIAVADEVRFFPEINLGVRSYSYDFDNKSLTDINFPALKVGLTGVLGNFYGNFAYETSLSSNNTGDISSTFQDDLGDVATMDRVDYSFSLGYKIADQFSIFGGYTNGSTELSFDRHRDIALDHSTRPYTAEEDVDADGFFAGLAYGWNLGPGNLGIKAAYAWLDGQAQQTYYLLDDHTHSKIKSDGDTTGYSLGLKWTAPLAERLLYTASLDYHKYEYDLKYSHGVTNLDGSSSRTIDESQVSARVGLVYSF